MEQSNSTVARRIAEASLAFEQRRTGHAPRSVTVVMSENTLVITLHGALSAVERALAKNPAGAAEVQEYHRQLFANSFDSLRQEIKRITSKALPDAVITQALGHLELTVDPLVSTLKREAGTPTNGRDPAPVARLRTAQRNWLAYRDEECRRDSQPDPHQTHRRGAVR